MRKDLCPKIHCHTYIYGMKKKLHFLEDFLNECMNLTRETLFIQLVIQEPWMTSKCSVVDEHEDDQGGVEDGESDEQLVEGVAHLLPREDRHWEEVAGKTDGSYNRHQHSLKLHSPNIVFPKKGIFGINRLWTHVNIQDSLKLSKTNPLFKWGGEYF